MIARLRSVLFPGVEQARHARREPAPEFVHPYPEAQAAREAGERFRARYASTPLFAQTVQATGTEPDVEGKAAPKPDAVAILNARRDANLEHFRTHGGTR